MEKVEEEPLSVAESARQMKTTISYVYDLLWAGRLVGNKVGGKWQVSAASVRERIQKRQEKE
jgi:excisionase family DNA binding protein